MTPLIVFDFDCTLADSLETLIRSYNHVAMRFGGRSVNVNEIRMLRAQKPKELLHSLGLRWWQIPRIMQAILNEQKKIESGISLFPGIRQVVQTLTKDGYKVGVLSTNREDTITQVLKREGILELFVFVYGGARWNKKGRWLRSLKRKYGVVVYVGDEVRDIEAAKHVDIPIIAVDWGMNNHETLRLANPEAIVSRPKDLLGVISEKFAILPS